MAAAGVVVSIGSINLDIQVRAERFPRESETVLATDYLRAGGGKAANVALVAARLGLRAQLFGRVGDDVFADLALSPLRAAGVDVAGVSRVSGQPTATSMIVVREDGDKTIVLAANANECWATGAEEEVARCVERAPAGSVVTVDLEVPTRIVRAALQAARRSGHVTVLDPSPAQRMEGDLLELCDYLTPNPREAERLTGVKIEADGDAERAGKLLLSRGVRHACMKLPDGGAVLVSADHVHTVHPPKVKVIDKTGAGDAFAGGLTVALVESRSPRDAVQFGVLTSSFAVTRYGSQAAYPSRDELERFAASVAG